MPVLIYHDHDGHTKEISFKDEISLGSDKDRCGIVLPAAQGVAPWHAVVVRAALNHLPVLVAMTKERTLVNGRPVIGVQVLRQQDIISLGQVELAWWEIRVILLEQGHRAEGKPCLVCTASLEAGREVVACPQCFTTYHRDCWFSLEKCGGHNCSYEIELGVMDVLASSVTFERDLTEKSELVEVRDGYFFQVREGKKCQANLPGDQVPFQVHNNVAFCPSHSCRAPYHFHCWLQLEQCRWCNYDIKKLLNQVFCAPTDVYQPIAGESHARK